MTTNDGRRTESGCDGDYDICYDGLYAGTPEPVHEPSGVGNCKIFIFPRWNLSQNGP